MICDVVLKEKTITSLEVAAMCDVRHADLMKTIRNYCAVMNEGGISLVDFFVGGSYIDKKNEERPCFMLTKKGCSMVANKMTGDKGVIFTAKYVTRFEEMENKIKELHSYMIENPVERAKMWIKEQEEKLRIEALNKRLMHDTKLYTATEIAKECGFRSAAEMNKELKEMGIQFKVNGTWVLSADYTNLGYESIKQEVLDNGRVVYHRKFTQEGREWLIELFE